MFEDTTELENLTTQISNTLWRRQAENEVPEFTTWDDLEERFEFDPMFRQVIRDMAEELDLKWIGTTAGLYIGTTGEQAKEYSAITRWLRSRGRTVRNRIMIMGKNGTVEDMKTWQSLNGHHELNSLPSILKALGSPLPDEVKRTMEKS